MARTLNFLLYQIGWFACVLGAAYSRPALGITIALFLVGVHLYLMTERANQAKLLIVAFGVGLIVDTTLLALDTYRFRSGMVLSWLPPAWMSVLWIQFATTFRYCLDWLSGRYAISSLLGLAGAPLAFLGGERLGAISFLEPRLINLLMLGVLWSVAIPLLIFASDRIHAGSELAASYRGLDAFGVGSDAGE
jgi:hypothetical protein